MKKSIPNLITLMNLTSGFLAIFVLCNYESNEKVNLATILILAAVFFDIADGLMARLLRVTSPIGRDLDSLSDLVSFGVAPTLLVYEVYFANDINIIVILVMIMFPVMGAYRLARFNNMAVSEKSSDYFKGVPITFAGMLMVILVILNGILDINEYIILICIGIFSLMMVLTVKIPSLKKGNIHLKLFLLGLVVYLIFK